MQSVFSCASHLKDQLTAAAAAAAAAAAFYAAIAAAAVESNSAKKDDVLVRMSSFSLAPSDRVDRSCCLLPV